MKRHLNKVLPVLFIALSMCLFAACDGDLGQKLGNAGLNTLMGMGVVFLVLILISFVISAFDLINKAEEKKKAAVPAAPAPVPAAPAAAEEPEEDLADDLELVAVIAAAIAASENTSPDGLVVRSIRKVSSRNQWKRG